MSASSPAHAGERILADATALSFPRAAGTPGDVRAREWLLNTLRERGHDPVERRFRYSLQQPLARMRTGLLLLSIGVVLTALAGSIWGWPAIVILVVCGGFGIWDLRRAFFDDESFALDDRQDAELETQNISVKLGASPSRRVVLVAHLDCKSQNISFLMRGALATVAVLGTLTLPLCLRNEPPLWTILGPIAAAISLRALGWLSFENESPGALDNAASVAVVLDVLTRLKKAPPSHIEVIGLFTGAEEHAMAGARIAARDHAAVWKNGETLVINHDGVGAPGAVGVAGRGGLVRSALRELRAAGRSARRIILPLGTGTDAMPLGAAGLDVVTITTARLSKAVLAIHTTRDVASNLDVVALAAAADVTETLVRAHDVAKQ